MIREPEIIYQDDAIIVLDKPPGLSVHGDGKSETPMLVDWLLKKFPDIASIGEPMRLKDGSEIERPGIVHRIDRETSGILLVARTQSAFVSLKHQFQKREVSKTYRAFVYGKVTEERGLIDRPVGRTQGSGSRRSVRDPRGTLRPAQTVFRRIQSTASASYVELFPKTGRTHQIRVHLASIDHPVICDALYAPGRPPLLGFSRLALHALSLSFEHPQSGKRVSFEAPLPEDFRNAEKELQET